MEIPILVVARGGSVVNKFEQHSLQGALNLKDFLEQTGEYKEVLMFQRVGAFGPMGEWVEIEGVEC
jgi:hypothetical protein